MALKLNDSVKLTVIDGEGVLLNTKDGTYFGVDDFGTEIIQVLDEEKDLSEVVTKNTEGYEVDKDQVKEDIDSFIEELKKYNLVSES